MNFGIFRLFPKSIKAVVSRRDIGWHIDCCIELKTSIETSPKPNGRASSSAATR